MNLRRPLLTRRTALMALPAIAAALGLPARAEDWPSHVVKIVVPYPAGGGTDALARVVADKLRGELGQMVIVENRTGAGGNVGTEAVARSTPDGYTLLMGDNSMAIYPHLYPKLNYDPIKDLMPVAAVAVAPIVLVSSPAQPYQNLAELLQAMKAEPKRFDYAFGGMGTPQHLAGQLFNKRAGVAFNGVPYRGSGPALQDVLGNQTGYGFFAVGSVLPHIRSGRLRAYGIALEQRSALAPEIPTFAEQGVSGVEAAVRYFVAAPVATPAAIVAKLGAAVERLRRDPALQSAFEKQGVDVGIGSPDDVKAMLLREGPVWGELIRTANIKPD